MHVVLVANKLVYNARDNPIHGVGSPLAPVMTKSVACRPKHGGYIIVRDHIMKYLLDNKLLSSKQYGFTKGRSTMLQLLPINVKKTVV